MSAWYDYPTERPQPAPIYPRVPGWSRAQINAANQAAPPQPERNAAILAYAAGHPGASFTNIGRHFSVTRNVVAGVLDRARNGCHGQRRASRGEPAT